MSPKPIMLVNTILYSLGCCVLFVCVVYVLRKCVCAQSYLTLYNPRDCSLPGLSVHGIFQARILERVVISFPRDLLGPGIKPMSLVSPALAGGFFTTVPRGKPH